MSGCFCRFGLIVTGSAERESLHELFRSLCNGASCTFSVIRKIGQRSPITSPKRLLQMVGSGQTISDRDAEEIGFPARRFLTEKACSFVLLIDDLEHDRREHAQAIFDRYRAALNTILISDELRRRAAVHFLVNMLEAYYFVSSAAVNAVAGRKIFDHDYAGDVEEIRHPKNELKVLWPEYNEIEHTLLILRQVALEHVLSNHRTCCWLRSLVAWCMVRLSECGAIWDQGMASRYRLQDGATSPTTFPQ